MTAINLNTKKALKKPALNINFDVLLTGIAGIGLIAGIIFQVLDFSLLAVFAYSLVYIGGGLPAAIGALKKLRLT